LHKLRDRGSCGTWVWLNATDVRDLILVDSVYSGPELRAQQRKRGFISPRLVQTGDQSPTFCYRGSLRRGFGGCIEEWFGEPRRCSQREGFPEDC